MFLFVGSNNEDAGDGLRTLRIDPTSGVVSEVSRVRDAKNPIYLAVSSDAKWLYAVEDVSEHVPDCPAGRPGGVSSFRVEADGFLTRVASVALAPTVPCHVSLSADGTRLAWAEYRKAHAGVVALGDGGALSPVASVHHEGRGPNPVRQESAHCHWAGFAPDDRTILVCDLGLDRVFAYECDEAAGTMRHIVPSRDYVAPGGHGPRHIAFLPGTDLAGLVCELASTATLLRIPRDGGPIAALDSHSLLPEGWSGTTKAAAIRFSPDGKWLLASNRGHDSVAAFRVDADAGTLSAGPISRLDGPFPRDFAFVPGGHGLVVLGHKLAGEVAVYRFDSATGALSRVPGVSYRMEKPLAFVFAPEAGE